MKKKILCIVHRVLRTHRLLGPTGIPTDRFISPSTTTTTRISAVYVSYPPERGTYEYLFFNPLTQTPFFLFFFPRSPFGGTLFFVRPKTAAGCCGGGGGSSRRRRYRSVRVCVGSWRIQIHGRKKGRSRTLVALQARRAQVWRDGARRSITRRRRFFRPRARETAVGNTASTASFSPPPRAVDDRKRENGGDLDFETDVLRLFAANPSVTAVSTGVQCVALRPCGRVF